MEIQEYSIFIHNLYHGNVNKILRESAEKLGELTEPNTEAILALVCILKNHNDELVKWKAIRSLGNIAIDNYDAIEALIEVLIIGLIPSRYLAAESLSQIAGGNEQVIISLTNLIYNTEDKVTLNCVSNVLGSIATDDRNSIDALVYLKNKILDSNTRLVIAQNINSITEAHPEAFDIWLDIIRNEDEYNILYETIRCLSEVSAGDKFIIHELKKITRIKGNDKSTINRRKIAEIGLWQINNNLFKKVLKIIGSIMLYMALPLFCIFQLFMVLYLWLDNKFKIIKNNTIKE